MDLLVRDHRGRGNQQMIAGDAVYRTLHGVYKQPASHGCLGHTSGKIQCGGEWLFARLVGDELHAPQHPNAPNVAYRLQFS
jgi:hypothetical protein